MQNTIKETFEPNKKQKEAIDITEGPVMLLVLVIAKPILLQKESKKCSQKALSRKISSA